MKDLLNALLLCFDTEKEVINETESFLSGTLSCTGKMFNDNVELVKEILQEFPIRDKTSISFTTITETNLRFTNTDTLSANQIRNFLEDIEPEDTIEIEIKIDKLIYDNNLSVYCYDIFINYLQSKSLFDLMCVFSKLLKNIDRIFFITFDNNEVFATNTIIFQNQEIEKQPFCRIEKMTNCKKASCFYNFNEISLIPEDFDCILGHKNNQLKDSFAKIKTILSMAYIVNTASITDNNLFLQISGYKNSQFQYNLNKEILVNEELFKIYKWIYTDGNCIDKAAIARNIISLHCQYTKIIETDGKTMSSIQSNYQIYQKDNVDQYLNLKNKLTEYIITTFEKLSDAIIQLSDRLKANVFAFLTFLVASFFTKVASGKELEFFNKEMTVLSYLVFICSIIFLCISFLENKYKLDNIKDAYNSLKNSYTDLLDENDINEIFENDNKLSQKMDSNKKLRNKIFFAWGFLIMCGIICIEILSQYAIIYPNIMRAFQVLLFKLLRLCN